MYDDDMTVSDIGAYFFDQSSTLGDLNNDNQINVFDIVVLVNIILSNDYIDNADLNDDNSVNIQDVIVMINIILYL